MRVVFVSVYLNLHQLPFCLEMRKHLGDGFSYISTSPITQDRLDMGFENLDETCDFVIKSYESREAKDRALNVLLNADVAIMGSSPEEFLRSRLRTKKLTFKYSERYFKGARSLLERLHYFYSAQRYIRPLHRGNVYFLCASAYTASDVNQYFDFSSRCFRWGYFRENSILDTQAVLRKKRKGSILWVGRLIDWKHPETALEIAQRLKEEKIPAQIKVIGDGPMRVELEAAIQIRELSSVITLQGALPTAEVRKEMEASQIALFTSDYKEGWGMVVNEAMNACCAIVASEAMGAVPFLISDEKNGFVVSYKDIDAMYDRIVRLLSDPQLSDALGTQAYRTILEEWDISIAVERLLKLTRNLLARNVTPSEWEEGPCSIAPVMQA